MKRTITNLGLKRFENYLHFDEKSENTVKKYLRDVNLLREFTSNKEITKQVLLDFKVMLTLNDTGAFLWEKLSKGIKIEDLVAEFIQEYDVDIAVAREDIEEFLIKLKENNFIE